MDPKLLHTDLTCPITQDLLQDPISVPCCGKAFSRTALVQWHTRHNTCPTCNANLENFDPQTAAKNVVLAGLVETVVGSVPQRVNHSWSAEITPIKENGHHAQLKLTLEDSKFSIKPSLFIAVLDRSGSMGGNPSRQVSTALKHIWTLASRNEHVKLVMLSYGSDCKEIQDPSEYKIDGGTNFRSAFQEVDNVLRRYMCSDDEKTNHLPNNVSSVNVAFLTDGEDTSGQRDRLVPEFRDILRHRWGNNPLSVHAVGFGQGCDRNLLEGMREAGTIPGIFRYAEPGDDDDTLCQKLMGIFEVSSQGSTVQLNLNINGNDNNIRFSVNSRMYGEYKQWIDLNDNVIVPTVRVTTNLDLNVLVPVVCKPPNQDVYQLWVAHLVDKLACDILEIGQSNYSKDLKDLYVALILQKIEALGNSNTCPSTENRLKYMEEQIKAFAIGKALNLGKLSDLRFGSLFAEKSSHVPQIRSTYVAPECKKIEDKPYNELPLKRYNRNNEGSGRNDLQKAISLAQSCDIPQNVMDLLKSATIDDVNHKDKNGNNSLMLAAYCGHCRIVKEILSRFPTVRVNEENLDGETAVTLAIKKRGFHFTLGFLLDAGGVIPRPKPLERFAIDHGFTTTAQIIGKCNVDNNLHIDANDPNMTVDYVKYMFTRSIESKKSFDVQNYLKVALSKGLKDMASTLCHEYKAVPTIDMLVNYCIPQKPDAPDTDHYLELSKLVLSVNPKLIHEVTEIDKESALFIAAMRGSLPHVKYFISMNAKIDQPNHKGNTPFWVASFMRWPCIISELEMHGANVNWSNLKGNIPLYGPCTRGSVKVAEQLMSLGANIDHVNSNGDTLILLCCRNGQYEVLQFLLGYVDMNFVNFKAHIDGFNAIMASAEQNRDECIRVLMEYGVDLNQKTDENNAILQSASSLHIACYYGRKEAACKLIDVGADIDIQDAQGKTPLHMAVIQGYVEIIKLLRNRGANMNIQDFSHNVPMAYCRDRQDIRDVLVNPVLDVLMKLCKGRFSIEDENKACDILMEHTGVPDCLDSRNAVDVTDYDGSTPLIQSVIHGKFKLVDVLLALKANPTKTNNFGMNSLSWAAWMKNRRVLSSLTNVCPDFKDMSELGSLSPIDRQMLFLGICPDGYVQSSRSGIMERMESFINTGVNPLENEIPTLLIENKNVERISFSSGFETVDPKELSYRIWDAKIFVTNIKSMGKYTLSVLQSMAMALFVNNISLSMVVNMSLVSNNVSDNIKTFISTIYQSLQTLPPYTGEVFIGSSTADRRMYPIGRTFQWNHFVSSSTLWRVALDNTPSFTSKSKKGVIFIVKSKTGRFVAPYSPFSFDCEVIFLPYTAFQVTKWYHGDVIAFGQENIREHTFGIKEIDDERLNLQQMIDSEKSLIIELQEV